MKSDRLRIGILIESFAQPAWVHRVIEQIQSSDIASIVLVILDGTSAPFAPGLPPHDGDESTHSLFAAYERFDRSWFKDDRLDPFDAADVRPLVEGVPQIATHRAQREERLASATIEEIVHHRLDVALRFGTYELQAHELAIARHGVWSYHHGHDLVRRGGPPGFWEVIEGNPVTGSILTMDSEALAGPRAIYRSFSSTAPISLWKNRRDYYWKSAAFVMRKLRDLSELGPATLEDPLGPDALSSGSRRYGTPTNPELILSLPKILRRYLATKLTTRTSFDQWFLAYKFTSSEPVEDGVPDATLRDFNLLVPPKDRLWADPFPIRYQSRYYILLEELLFARNKGHISVIEFDDNARPTRPELVLQTADHLSYPFVFGWMGDMFMVPESARAGDLQEHATESMSLPVFRARNFPYEWVPESAMLEGMEVFDPTVVEIEGVWWLFCTRAEQGASTWDELHLFHGRTPFGPWEPHRRNPVKSDVRSARPAGRPFRSGGEWFRPAQDCSVRYGYAISLNRIERLTPTEYKEIEVSRINPAWTPGLVGTHTLNAAGRLTVIDGQLRRRRWSPEAPLLPPRTG
jgi:hypothetical protein